MPGVERPAILTVMRVELTRRADYAVRAMLALAAADPGARVPARQIADTMAIPPRFLPQILRDLAIAGLVEAQTGRSGGYRLTRSAHDISLLEVVDAVDPTPRARVCVLRGGPCGLDGHCAVHDVFADAQAAVTQRLARANLAESARVPGARGTAVPGSPERAHRRPAAS